MSIITASRHLCVLENATVSFLSSGDKSMPCILFLHGIPASAELWRSVMEKMAAQGFYCVAPDLPGYGQTVLTTSDYSLSACAHIVREFLNTLNIQKSWLVAHDIGGGIAQILMTQYPSLFSKATLGNCITANTWPVWPIKLLRLMAQANSYAISAHVGLFPNIISNRELKKSLAKPELLTSEVVRRVFWDDKVYSATGRVEFQKMLKALDAKETQNNMDALKKVSIPIQLLWGEKDHNQPWSGPGEILANTFPNALITKIPEASHFLQIDYPEEYALGLLKFLDVA